MCGDCESKELTGKTIQMQSRTGITIATIKHISCQNSHEKLSQIAAVVEKAAGGYDKNRYF